jgi:hypothetical protein
MKEDEHTQLDAVVVFVDELNKFALLAVRERRSNPV